MGLISYRRLFTLCLLGPLLGFVIQKAHASMMVDLYTLASYPKVMQGSSKNSAQGFKGGIGFPGFGLGFTIPLTSFLEMQLHGLQVKRMFWVDTTSYPGSLLSVQMGLGLFPLKNFGLESGVYSNFKSANPLNLVGDDIGAYVGVNLRIPVNPGACFFLRPQYRLPLHPFGSTFGSIRVYEMILMAGFHFGN